MGTDSRHFADLAGGIYRFGPLVLGRDDLKRIHGVDERLRVQGIADAVSFYTRLIENIANQESEWDLSYAEPRR